MAKKRKSGNMTDQPNTSAADAVAAAALASLGGATQSASTTLATESSTLHSIAAAAAQQTAQQQAEQQAMDEVSAATAAAILPNDDSEDAETEIEAEETSEPSDYDIGLEKVNAYIDNYFPEMVGQEPNIRWGHFCINFPGMIGHAGKVADYTLIPHEYRERFEEELAAI